MREKIREYIEVIAVFITGILKFIFLNILQMRAIYIISICLCWFLYVYFKYRSNPKILEYWGFRSENFKSSVIFILPFTIFSIIVFTLYAILKNTDIFNIHILPIFILYPLWGLIQQFIMIGIIFQTLKNSRKIKLTENQTIMIICSIFSIVHFPYLWLMIFTFFMEYLFVKVFLKYRNIWAIGLHHGWIATFLLFYGQNRDLFEEMIMWFRN